MIDLCTDVVTKLAAESAFTGWSYRIGSIPADTPDDIIVFTETPGYKPSLCYDKTVKHTQYGSFQITVRSTSYATGQEKVRVLYNLVTQHAKIVLTGVSYLGFFPESKPRWLQEDEKGRTLWMTSFRVVFQETA